MEIKSPFWQPKDEYIKISSEQFDQIKKILGTRSVVLFCMKEEHANCQEEDCKGHPTSMSSCGFTEQMMLGIADGIIKKQGGVGVIDENFFKEED